MAIKKHMRILIIAFSPLDRDSRVYRQLLFFKSFPHSEITVAGYTDPKIDDVNFVRLDEGVPKSLVAKAFSGIKLKLGRFEQFYWEDEKVKSALGQLNGLCFDIIVANDLPTLPLSLNLARKNGAKVLIDCHEYTPREFDDQFKFSFFLKKYWDYICRKYLPKSDIFTTVCCSLADEYQKNYGGDWKVITNAPFYADLNPKALDNSCIRLIHHGIITPSRHTEKMIELMNYLDERYLLDLMLINTNPSYFSRLKRLAKNNPRINFRDPVAMTEIVDTINNYDIGLFLLPPFIFNYQMALPNKLFDYIQARLAVAIWPSPEMSKIVKQYECGVVANDFSVGSMAKALNALSSEDIMRYKMNSHKAAATLCAEKNHELFIGLINSLLD
ncbi:MAG: hypothetical protein ACQ9MH_25525 [Nitrospinales bacterium]